MIDASVKTSELFKKFQQLRLKKNMRVGNGIQISLYLLLALTSALQAKRTLRMS